MAFRWRVPEIVSGVCGEVKKWFFCEGVVESVEGACRFLLAWYLNFCAAGLFGA